jgi:hypothetical protein
LLAGVTAVALAATPLVTAGAALAATPFVTASPARAAAAAGHTETGLYGSTDPTYDGVYRQSLAILGLHAAGLTPRPEAVMWLLRQQCADGGYSSYNPDTGKPCPAYDSTTFTGGEDTNATAVAVQALLALDRTKVAKRAATWLTTLQNADGGWEYTADANGGDSDPNSTGLVMTALTAAGVKAKDAPKSGVEYVASMQVGRADFAGTPAADGGGIATPWQPTTPDVLATVQAVPGITGANLLTVPTGSPWQDGVGAVPESVPAAGAAGVSHWATTWLGAQVDAAAVTASNAPWAILSFAWDRRGETVAHGLYANQIAGQVPADSPGANGQAALAAAVLGKRSDVATYAKNIAATLQRDTTGPVTAVVAPRGAKKAASWKKLDITAADAGSGVAKVKVAVSQKRAGTWYAYNGTTWKKTKNGHARYWLTAHTRSDDSWRLKVPGLTKGKLVVRAKATDAADNTGKAAKATQRLTKKK